MAFLWPKFSKVQRVLRKVFNFFLLFFLLFVDGQPFAQRTRGVNCLQLLSFDLQRHRRSTKVVFMSTLLLSQVHQHDFAEGQGALLHPLLEANGTSAAGYEA